MAHPTKIATCCYCGTKAALVLSGTKRHELACAACGAPLHDLKYFKASATLNHPVTKSPKKKKRKDGGVTPLPHWEREIARKPKKRKKSRKSLGRKLFSEALDIIDDIFD